MRHLLGLECLRPEEFDRVMHLARQSPDPSTLGGTGVAAVFEKPSARTRNSIEMAAVALGGHPVYITDAEVGIDTRETAEDVIRTLACYHRIVCARVFDHEVLVRMAAQEVAPIVNLLSDRSHPLQGIADGLTLLDEFGSLQDRVVAYVGDANNVTRSLILAVGRLGGTVRVASPPGFGMDPVVTEELALAGVSFEVFDRPQTAVQGADAIYTDTWISMGDEAEAEDRRRAFEGFTVDDSLLALASADAIFMHCLPAHRGEEATDAVLDGPRSRIWSQAAHRLSAAIGALAWIAEVNQI